jgi:hypothetical protein
MDDKTLGLIGAAVGGTLGLAGGIIGTWFSLRSVHSDDEKRSVIRWAALLWLVVIGFLMLLFLAPAPYRWLVWIPYPLLLIWMIRHCKV